MDSLQPTALTAAPQALAEQQGWIWARDAPQPDRLSPRDKYRNVCLVCQSSQLAASINPLLSASPPITDFFLIMSVNQISKPPFPVITQGKKKKKCQSVKERTVRNREVP